MSLWTRIRNAFSSERLDNELTEELRQHLEEAEAHHRTRAFGNPLLIRERSHDAKVLGWLEALLADTRFGWRQLRKNWKVSGAAILSLALAIGACTGAFRLIDAALLRPLPVADPNRLFYITNSYPDETGKLHEGDAASYPLYKAMRNALKGDADLLAISYASRVDLTYAGDNEMEKAYRQYISGNVFGSFGLRPAVGRLIGPSDDEKPGAHPVAVISYDYWTSRFSRDPKAIGRKFRMRQQSYEIIGVAPEGFTGTDTGSITAIFIPTMMNADAIGQIGQYWFRVWMRPDHGRSLEPLRDSLQAAYTQNTRERIRGWAATTPKQRIDEALRSRVAIRSAAAGVSGMQKDFGRALVTLGVLVGLILLIACANVANLLTAQAVGRAREMALRVSIGAGRGRLIQLVLVESAMLSLAATVLGGLFAWWSAPWVVSTVNPHNNPMRLVLPADGRVLGFATLLAVSVTVLFGLVPALRASSVKPMQALKGGEARSKFRLMHSLVALQVAFCFIVHFLTGLFGATLERLSNQPLGFSPDRILLLETNVKDRKQQVAEDWSRIAAGLLRIPNVESASVCSWALMGGSASSNTVRIPGHSIEPFEPFFLLVSPGFLPTMKIPLLAGRDFRPGDKPGSSKPGEKSAGVAIVDEAFAQRYFDGQNPVGRFFERPGPKDSFVRVEIVGYMRDLRYRNMRDPMPPVVFLPLHTTEWATFAVRITNPDPISLATALRAEIHRIRPDFLVSNTVSQKELVDGWTVRERLLARLSLFFAVVALLLASIGLYGVLNYFVVQRTREIGIRMALGARAMNLICNVTAQMFGMLVVGSAAGLAAGLASERYLTTLLYSVKTTDVTMIAIPFVSLCLAGLLAGLPPAIRAIRIDPAQALRSE